MNRLTPTGRLTAVAYRLRAFVVRPADDADRCFMGAPVDAAVWCPRPAASGSLWCHRHQETAA